MITKGFDPNVEWTPFVKGDRVGYKVRRLSDGAVTYLYMNPSTEGDGEPDVFVYCGPNGDPAKDDLPVCFLTPEWRDNK